MIRIWQTGGGCLPHTYGFGYWTGKQKDLLCTRRCKINEESEIFLSPLHRSRLVAFVLFLKKRKEKENG